MSTKRIKKQPARAAMTRAVAGSDFPPERTATLRDLLPRYRGRPEDVKAEMASALHGHCTLCGAESFTFRTYWTTPEERSRWGADWLGFALCLACFATPELSQQRLAARFRYFLDPPESSLPS